MRHLNGGQLHNANRTDFLILFDILVFELHNAPNTTAQQTIIFQRIIGMQRNTFKTPICKFSFIAVLLNVQMRGKTVNDGIRTTLTELCENNLSFIGTDIVFGQDTLYILHANRNDGGIVGVAILSQEELKDIDGHICTLLDSLGQIFANDLAVEKLTQLLIENSSTIHSGFGFCTKFEVHVFIHLSLRIKC